MRQKRACLPVRPATTADRSLPQVANTLQLPRVLALVTTQRRDVTVALRPATCWSGYVTTAER